MGKVGYFIGVYNRYFFGYISFFYIFIFIKPIFLSFYDNLTPFKIIKKFTSLFSLLLSLLLFQSLISSSKYSGRIGNLIVDFFSNYIGSFGVFIISLIMFFLSLISIFEYDYHKLKDLIEKIKTFQYRSKLLLEELKYTLFKSDIEFKNRFKSKYQEHIVNRVPNFDEFHPLKEEKKKDLPLIKEREKIKKESKSIFFKKKKFINYKKPDLNFLKKGEKRKKIDEAEIDKKIRDLLEKLKMFKIDGDVINSYSGPIVTTFEFKPAPDIKVSKILNLQDDLAMTLMAKSIIIQAPVPGKNVVGIEIPNKEFDTIYLRDILESEEFKNSSNLTIALGVDVVGNPYVTDLTKLPHLLIAGTTGSGKSVGINSIILSLLYKNSPKELRLIMIDPKMLEFAIYDDIPHLLTPVITKPQKAIVVLSNLIIEMERRYRLMSQSKTKNIESYNKKAEKENREILPYIVVVIDELADLMMTSGKDVEFYIARLAQMARASGIHLIVATQRPSVDVVTGLIKANLPSRISYRVGQKIDSRVILDSSGAEALIGRGDMLFTEPKSGKIIRLHSPFTTEEEIERVVEYLKSQAEVEYDENFLIDRSSENLFENKKEFEELYKKAKEIVLKEKNSSINYIQRKLKIGYNKADKIVEQLKSDGVI